MRYAGRIPITSWLRNKLLSLSQGGQCLPFHFPQRSTVMPTKSSNRARIKIAQRRRNTRRATLQDVIAKQRLEATRRETYLAAKASAKPADDAA